MSKRTLIVLAAVLTVLVGAGAGVFIFSQKKAATDANPQTNLPNLFQVALKSSGSTLSYQDESGYSFDYPDSVSIKDVTPADDNYYSSLELKKGTDVLTIKITVGNTNPYKTDKTASLIGSAPMDGITANQYKVGGRLVSIAIDQGVLYAVDGPADAAFWEETQNKILSTFKFGTGEAAAAADVNTTYEEETVE